jgi:hypothetical protein
MNATRILALIVMVMIVGLVIFRGMNARRLTSRDARDRSLKIMYLLGLAITLLFIIGEVLIQTHVI